MTSTPPLDLDAIQARANAANKGPWFATKDGVDGNVPLVFVNRTSPKGVTYSSVLWNADWATEADAEFTAHAREDVSALLAEVHRLRAELEQAASAVQRGLDVLRVWRDEREIGPEAARLLYEVGAELTEAAAEETHVVADDSDDPEHVPNPPYDLPDGDWQ
ncbi:hypothetical protein [Streptomyces antimycoticus]|uniref:hypothetical protein n=1 Tax=Streptomyces TaxID=1883 RepID=UPI0033F9BCE9